MFKERVLPFNYGMDLGPHHNFSPYSPLLKPSAALTAGWDGVGAVQEWRSFGMAATRATMTFGDQFNKQLAYESFASSEVKAPHFNTCNHKVVQGVNYPFSVALYIGSRRYVQMWEFYRLLGSCEDGIVADLNGHHDVPGLLNAQRSAWGIMQPRYEGDISMFNFIVELKDFRSLARFLLNKPLKRLKNLFRRIRKKRRLDYSKPLAQSYLANEFALKPLISDIFSITCQMEELVQSHQQNFADAGRERNSRHYTEIFNILEDDCRSAYTQSSYPQFMVGENEMFTFNATMEYSYEYNMRSTLDAFMKYWRVLPDPEAIWNAIPCSFLIDYIYKIGDSLAINSRDKRVQLQLMQYCESYLSERTSGTHIAADMMFGPLLGAGNSNRYPGTSGNYLIAGTNATFYTRIVTSPNMGRASARIHKPTSRQGWNILALARCFF